MKEAMFYEKKSGYIKCRLCPHFCVIPEGKKGICSVRKNIGKKLYSIVYSKQLSFQIDPIEKKPLFHFLPGSKTYSFCTAGCNFKCSFCQNWQLSQMPKDAGVFGKEKSPMQIVEEALYYNCKSIAMTYTEPTIFFEYALDACKLAKKHNLKTVFVSNSYINKEPIDAISKYLDAINIDLKSFNGEFYKKTCGGKLQPVLDSIKYYHKKGVWVEITTLLIPGENDSEDELKKISGFIAGIDKNIPWHVSRFHPDYRMIDKAATPERSLEKAYQIGKKAGLNFVYTGNIIGGKEDTICPFCKETLIKRSGYNLLEYNIDNGKCLFCSSKVKGVFE